MHRFATLVQAIRAILRSAWKEESKFIIGIGLSLAVVCLIATIRGCAESEAARNRADEMRGRIAIGKEPDVERKILRSIPTFSSFVLERYLPFAKGYSRLLDMYCMQSAAQSCVFRV